MRTIRLLCLTLAISVPSALWAQVATADDAAVMYDPSTVYAIDLDLPQASVDELEVHPLDEYVQGFLTLTPTAGTPGTEATPLIEDMEVGIRLKGSASGSFRKLEDGKAAFKIKCNFVSGKKCLGLKKMTLNNMVQDPSMLHERLAYPAFRAAGVPSPRTGYAYVRVNGDDFGLYLNIETYDDVFLKREFGDFDDDVQHLYEGEYGDDVVPDGATDFEVDEGGEELGEIGDLEALIEAVNGEGDEPWSDRVAPNADLAEMVKMWAVEKYIDHWDGYSGHAVPTFRPNNYYLYSDLSGRFQMLPWGTDQAWIPTFGVGTPGREVTFDGEGGVLFNKCLEDEACFRAYWEALRGVRDAIEGLGLVGEGEGAAALLAPWQEEEREHGRAEYDAAETKEDKFGVDATLEFIGGRAAEADAWLAANEPSSIPDLPSSPTVKDPPPVTVPPLLFARSGRTGRWVTARLQLPGPGQIGLRATMRTRKGTKRACASSTQAGAAGEIAVGCKLSKAALRRLNQGALRLELTFTLTLADGRTETLVRSTRLPRSRGLAS